MASPYVPLPSQPDLSRQNPYAVYGYGGSYGGFSPYSPGVANSSQNWGTAVGQGGQDVNPNASMEDIFSANRNQASTTGNLIGQEGAQQLDYYGPQIQQFQQAQNQALNNLAQTPGYTGDEASKIGVDYSQFNTGQDQYARMAGDPNAPVSSVQTGLGNEGAMLNQYQSKLGGQLGNMGGGLAAAQGKFAPMDTAVNQSALGFDPGQTEKQLSQSDVNDLVTSAQTSVGNRYRTAEDTLERQAAAQGNTSPAAMAAMRQQLLTQEGSAAGDAATNARIAALQAQYGRAAGIEQQREGAVQTQAGMQATAATTEEAAAQAAAGQLGQAGISAANQYGQFSTGQANTMTGQLYGAQSTAEQLAAQRAAQQGQMQYQQGTGSQQLTSQGAQNLGQTRIAGEGAYRAGVAGQQGLAQQGGQQAQQTQLGAYGTQTSGVGAAANSQANFEVGKASFGDKLATGAANLLTSGAGLGGGSNRGRVPGQNAKGGLFTEPTTITAGEDGPEAIVPVGPRTPPRYKSQRKAA